MFADTRNRETLYGKYIFKYHPIYGGKVDLVYNREEDTRIEGGDELVLSKDVLAVGISQRTDAASIEKLLVNIFKKMLASRKFWPLNLLTTVNSCTWILSSLW